MIDKLEIKPLEGINDLKFGTTSSNIIKHLGEPEETEELEPLDDIETVLWHYWDKGLSIFFDKKIDLIFSSIEIDNPNAELWGHKVFDLNEEELKKIFISKGYTDLDVEKIENGEKRVSFDDAMVDLYFEKGKLIGVSYGIFIDTDISGLN